MTHCICNNIRDSLVVTDLPSVKLCETFLAKSMTTFGLHRFFQCELAYGTDKIILYRRNKLVIIAFRIRPCGRHLDSVPPQDFSCLSFLRNQNISFSTRHDPCKLLLLAAKIAQFECKFIGGTVFFNLIQKWLSNVCIIFIHF